MPSPEQLFWTLANVIHEEGNRSGRDRDIGRRIVVHELSERVAEHALESVVLEQSNPLGVSRRTREGDPPCLRRQPTDDEMLGYADTAAYLAITARSSFTDLRSSSARAARVSPTVT